MTLLHTLSDDEGLEPFILNDEKVDGFILFTSAVYYRSAWKYKNRAFRYCLLDSGHLLGCIEKSCFVHDRQYHLVYDFDKIGLNKAFGFNQEEFFLTACVVGKRYQQKIDKVTMKLPHVDATGVFEENPLIEQAYKMSVNMQACQHVEQVPSFFYQKEVLKEVMLKRRSIREFSKQAISKEQFESIMAVLNQAITSDCDEQVDIYCVLNRVKTMPLGLYKENICIKEGDFASKAGYLCLEQDLGTSSAVTFFLTSQAKNYQALYQKAGIIGHRLYLASNYLQIGCSGIGAYYDDEVCEFLGEHTQVLYALAIGN